MSVISGGNLGFGYPGLYNPTDNFTDPMVDPFVEEEADVAEDRVNAMQEELEEARKEANKAGTADQSMGVFSDTGPSAAGGLRGGSISFTA